MIKKHNNINGCYFKLRYVALMMDFFLCCFLSCFFIIPVLMLEYAALLLIDVPVASGVIVNVCASVIVLVFVCFFAIKDVVTECGSLGKKIMRIKIIDIDSHQKPHMWKLIVSSLLSLLVPIDYIIYKYSLNKFTLSDSLTSTTIIKIQDSKTGDGGLS